MASIEPPETQQLELGALHLAAGEGVRRTVEVKIEPLHFSNEIYEAPPTTVTVDIARMVGGGFSLRLRAVIAVTGPCLRCLEPVELDRTIDAREVDLPDAGVELESPYLQDDILKIGDWVHDALVLELPATMSPPTDAEGRCVRCKRTLVDLGAPPIEKSTMLDPRWAKLRELDLGDASDEPSPN